MAERSPAGPVRAGIAAALQLLLLAAPGAAEDGAAPGQAATAGVAASREITLLLLPSIRAPGERELNPWGSGADAARFVGLEEALGARLGESGYAVVTAGEALSRRGFRDVLARASAPMSPAWAAEAAEAAGAQAALVIRAEVIRTRGTAPPSVEMTDALLRAEAYRAPDGARLGSAATRVTGQGKTAAEADAEALTRAAPPLAEALEGPLRAGVARPVVEPRPMEILIEGRLDWRSYTQAVGLVREMLPEIGSLQERRFAPGRFTLTAVCGCEAGEAARRLDGLARGGLRLTATAEGAVLRVRASRGAARVPGIPAAPDTAFTEAPP